MGYSSTMVEKAISIHGKENCNEILEYLLACKVADYSLDLVSVDPTVDSERLEGDDESNFGEKKVEGEDTFAEHGDPQEDRSKDLKADNIIAFLLEMGYSEKEVSSAIEINGIDTPIDELVDFIDAHLCGKESNKYAKDAVVANHQVKKQKTQAEESCGSKFRKRKQAGVILNDMETSSSAAQKRAIGEKQRKVLKGDVVSNLCPEGLTGFGVPGKPIGQRLEEINVFMQGPPFFYYENDAFASKDIWKTISENFYGVEPEVVDSKYFSASRRPRGYVHNLPIEGRFQALPLPPMTIQEALPQTKDYWPTWDQRKKLNCIDSRRCGSVIREELCTIIENSRGKLQDGQQKYILEKCEEWNLVWVGPGQVAPLEVDEIEIILGFEKDHTRGTSCATDRLHCLGNAFQIDTVAYHLSVLKALYPDGIKVLSLFSGIGGAEVALHRLGIHLSCVVSVEICEKNRLVLNSWWTKTQQTGSLIQKEDVQDLNTEVLEHLVDTVGGFDLIIGGFTCNNLPGKNSRDDLETKSSIFYEFPRIVNEVREIMHSKASANNFS
ncbi:DNA (cytosine-5)-methyltransferase DRM2 isoform X2 [Cryptomeria japonica]|nr:DNA (cytosine-5)-methyltransferase DRM2 isoform X2 [Cryptomeria japonica]